MSGNEQTITLRVIDESNKLLNFRMKQNDIFATLMNNFCQRNNRDHTQTQFYFANVQIQWFQTPIGLQLKDNNVIEAIQVQKSRKRSGLEVEKRVQTSSKKKCQQRDPDPMLVLRVSLCDGVNSPIVDFYGIRRSESFERLMKLFCRQTGLLRQGVRFLYDGEQISDTATPATFNMKNQDTIEVFKATDYPDPDNEDIQFWFVYNNNVKVFNTKRKIKLGNAMLDICMHFELDPGTTVFAYKMMRLGRNDTPGDFGMTNGEDIVVYASEQEFLKQIM